MQVSIFRNLTAVSLLCLTLAISGFLGTSGASNFTPVRIMDSRGNKILSIYDGIAADARFVNQLRLSAGRSVSAREQPSPAFRTLAFREGKPLKCDLLATAFRSPRAAVPRPTSCNGQYMVAQYYECLGCSPDEQYQQYFNTGTEPCNGYYFPHLIADC